MAETAAVLDAPMDIGVPDAPDAPDTSVDTGLDASIDSSSNAPIDDNSSQAQEDRTTSQKPAVGDDNRLDPKVKSAIDNLYKTDPTTAARIRNSLMQGKALRDELPGGVKEAKRLKALEEDLGGQDGIEALRQGNQEFDSLSKQYMDGDPAFIADLVQSSEEAFCKMAPVIYGKFSELDNLGFTSMVAKTFVSHMIASKVENRIDLMEALLPEGASPRFTEALKGLREYFAGLQELASKPVNTPRQKTAPDDRETSLNQREQNFRQREMGTKALNIHNSIYTQSLTDLTKGQNLNQEQKIAISELYKANIKRAMAAKSNFKSIMDRHLANNDERGYLRHMDSFYKAETAKALKLALNHVKLEGAKPAIAAPQKNGPGNGARPPSPQPQKGYEWRTKMPPSSEFSPDTTTDMIKRGVAILRDGKKVQWKQFSKQ